MQAELYRIDATGPQDAVPSRIPMTETDVYNLVQMCRDYHIEEVAAVLTREYEKRNLKIRLEYQEMNFNVHGKCVGFCSWERFGKLTDQCWVCGNLKVRK